MATWMTHLRLAEKLLNEFDGLDPCAFAVGNLAPDSGIPAKNRETFSPPKKITHFMRPVKENPWRKADLLFYENYLITEPENSKVRFSFVAGYFLHLVTDNLWDQWIALPVERRYSKNFETDNNFIWTVKHDWYGLDFMYLHQNPDCFFSRIFKKCRYKPDFKLDFLLKKGLKRQLKIIRKFYNEPGRREWAENRPGIYLTEPEMDAFVRDAETYLKKIYNISVRKRIDLSGNETILDMYPAVRDN